MKVNGQPTRTIDLAPDGDGVVVIDQTRLPHEFATLRLRTLEDAANAIRTMVVRGAPLIGATAAFGLAIALNEDASDARLDRAVDVLAGTRPTAVNLRWALDRMAGILRGTPVPLRRETAYIQAAAIAEEDVATCRAIGAHGLPLIEAVAVRKPGRPVNILTHCNAGWLATVDYGTALSPIYQAYDAGIPVHVWVDETRPRNQGAALTAWELGAHGVPHTLIADNAGGHLMQAGEVDLCIVGTDRTTANGDVANKIGTYLKALAAHDNGVPFHVALPFSTIDWALDDGRLIPIEERDASEVTEIQGQRITAAGTPARNPAFDVTPARLVTSLITERGVAAASRDGLLSLYPERR
ncbi:S-methyl-5-thioribose-1-phosphate isomerase [Zavarzinia sp. CC-PAN008]|uniref:S-methyl-5-thioribose-1-phosphate isomerase n=1 Tax=Zavarzinia sp. CC-PAN008 TaxID=3243332 RepID=UPI003F747185